MRNLLNTKSRVLVIAGLAAMLAMKTKAQETILIKNQPVRFYPTSSVLPQAVSSEAPSFANKQFWILRSSGPKTKNSVAACNRLGIIPGADLGNGCQIATLPKGLPVTVLQELGFTSIAPFSGKLNIDPVLVSPSARINTSGNFQVQVLPHNGLKSYSIRQQWKNSWGQINEVWEGSLSKWVITCTFTQLDSLLASGWTQWIEPAESALVPYNQNASGNSRVNYVSAGSFEWANGLNGENVTVAVGDGGLVEPHADLEKAQENLTANKVGSFGDHQDHVTGTICGGGFLQSDKKGMAPGARVLNMQTSSVISTGSVIRENEQVTLTNNSYGNPLMCSRAGLYSATSAFIDDQVLLNPDMTHVFASGNYGANQCNTFPTGYNTIAEGYPVSKNVLTVGAVLPDDGFAWFSSIGPAKDGRLKPEIVADGNNLFSTVPFDSYGAKGGTSMATPVVTGTLVLLTQRFRELNNNQIPETALLKALVCNTAEDLGRPNVDFVNGFGRINGRKARLAIENQTYKSGSIGSNSQVLFPMVAPSGSKSVKITIAWTDPAGAVGVNKALVNNLNLSVVNGAGSVFLPWVLDPTPANVKQDAVRKVDTLNNIEQVTLTVSGNENIVVRVNSGLLAGINQKFWITYEWERPELVITSPVQNQVLNSGTVWGFRWDVSSLDISELILQSSSDSAQTWTDFQTISLPGKLFTDVNLPNPGFQKMWFRLKAQTDQEQVFSNIVGTAFSKKLSPTISVCDQTIALSWTLIPEATTYEVLQLDLENGAWNRKIFTSDNTHIFNQLENGKRYVFAVKPWFGTQPGLISDGKIGIPVPGNCSWTNDLGIAKWIAPQTGRMKTSTQPLASAPVQISVQNFGSNAISNQSIGIFCKMPDGIVKQTSQLLYLDAGEQLNITLPWPVDLSNAGAYGLKCWIQLPGDANFENDTLENMVRVIDNPAISLPWQYNAELLNCNAVSSTQVGVNTADFMDFNSVNQSRLQTYVKSKPEIFGGKSLVLDKQKIDGKTANGELILNLNLSDYMQADQLILDFDWVPLGTQTNNNGLWVRPNDLTDWIKIVDFQSGSYATGELKSYHGINLRSFMPTEDLSTSFQLKFTFEGTKPGDISNGNGYVVDNLVLSIPTKNVVVSKLLAPVDDCENTVADKLKIRLKNLSNETTGNIKVGYSYAGHAPVIETVAGLHSGDSTDYTFTTSLSTGLKGKVTFKLWAQADGDGYPTDDTVRNRQVFISPQILSYPYYEGFEQNDGFWKSSGEKSSWQWGAPTTKLRIIDTAANGVNIWKTNLSGDYNTNEMSYLQSPCFNLEDIGEAFQLSFNTIFNMENDYDYSWLEMSEDGQGWTKVGAKGQGTNWYNHDSQNWNGLQNVWQVASYRLSTNSIVTKSNVRFRIGFNSDISVVSEGIGIDDFHIEPAFEIVNDTIFKQSNPQQVNNVFAFGKSQDKIAEIENSTNLGSISLEMRRNDGPVRIHQSIPYLDRNFLIIPANQPASPVLVRLYITDAEVKKLMAVDGNMTSFQELGIFKYDGPNEDLSIENNDFTVGSSSFIPAGQVQKTPTSGGYFLEFLVSSFSEFYIATQSFVHDETPLPVVLMLFTAKTNPFSKSVDLRWKTASENNCDRFELSYSCDGRSFEPIQNFAPKGSFGQGAEYTFTHYPGNCIQPNFIYKLTSFDIGESGVKSQMLASCANAFSRQSIVVVNPIGDKLQVSGMSGGESVLELVDALGRVWLSTKTDQPDFESDTRKIPVGNYWLRIANEVSHQSVSLVKW